MNDDQTAQSSSSSNNDAQVQNQNQQGVAGQVQPTQPVTPVAPSAPSHPVALQPAAAPHNKEQAPVSEHVQVTDAVEAQPELHQELKEHGVEVKKDEAHLELTREQQQVGMQHSPQSQQIKPIVQEEQKPDFPMSSVQAETIEKKSSVLDSIRWLATYVLRQIKIKRIAEEAAK